MIVKALRGSLCFMFIKVWVRVCCHVRVCVVCVCVWCACVCGVRVCCHVRVGANMRGRGWFFPSVKNFNANLQQNVFPPSSNFSIEGRSENYFCPKTIFESTAAEVSNNSIKNNQNNLFIFLPWTFLSVLKRGGERRKRHFLWRSLWRKGDKIKKFERKIKISSEVILFLCCTKSFTLT